MQKKGLLLTGIAAIVLTLVAIPFMTACAGSTPTPDPSTSPVTTPEPSADGLLSSDALKKDYGQSRPSGNFEDYGPAVGEPAINFTLQDVNGNTVSLAGLLSEKPVVMVFGSFT